MNREQIKEFMGANGSEWITDLVEVIVRKAVEEDRSQRWLKEKAQLEAEWALLRQMQEATPKLDQSPDPCPRCRMGGVCRTPSCGRLKLPVDHPFRSAPKPDHIAQPDNTGADSEAILQEAPELTDEEIMAVYYHGRGEYMPALIERIRAVIAADRAKRGVK